MQIAQRKLRLHRGWGYLVTDRGLELWSVTTRQRFRIRTEATALLPLMHQLQTGILDQGAVEALAMDLNLSPVKVRRLLDHFRVLGAVVAVPADEPLPPGKAPDRQLYDSQVEHFSMWETEAASGADYDRRLRDRRVVVIGLGGFGSWTALLLSRMGIKELVGIDGDRVELSNVARQVLYTQEDIGALKAHAAARFLRAADADLTYIPVPLHLQTVDDLLPWLKRVDLVIVPFGYSAMQVRSIAIAACLTARVPFLTSGGFLLGPLCIPGQTPCPQCIVDQDANLATTYAIYRANHAKVWSVPDGPFVPSLAMIASYVAAETARFLAGHLPANTLRGIYVMDPREHQVQFVPFDRRSDCSVCGSLPSLQEH